MEYKKRTWAKAITWQVSGLIVMTVVNYLYLGSLQQGVGLSLMLTGLGLISYVIHERLWARVHWGIQLLPDAQAPRTRPVRVRESCA